MKELQSISHRISDYDYSVLLEHQLEQTNERIKEFKKLMDKALYTIQAQNVLDTYVNYVSYLDGSKTLEECQKLINQ